jgi:hypothetical protein
MRKYTSLISFSFGLIGLIAIIYFNYRVNKEYDELGGLSNVITLFIYGRMEKILLYLLTGLGIIAGTISITKLNRPNPRIIGFAGVLICSINLIILLLDGL